MHVLVRLVSSSMRDCQRGNGHSFGALLRPSYYLSWCLWHSWLGTLYWHEGILGIGFQLWYGIVRVTADISQTDVLVDYPI